MPKISRRRATQGKKLLQYDGWPRGLDTYQPKNKIRPDAFSDCQNVEIFVKTVEKRLGTQYVGNSKDSRTRGLTLYTHSDGTKKLVRSSGTTLQEYNESTDNYDNVTGKTYTSDLNTDYILAYDDLYVFNGIDNLTKYNVNDSPKITVYTQIGPPTSPSAARGAGLADGQYTAYFKLAHFNEIGETTGTTEFSVAYDIPRSQWDGVTEKIDVSWTCDVGVDADGGTVIFFSDTSGDTTYIDSVSGTATAWSFLGGEIEPDGITEPKETNSTGGIIAYKGDFDGVRLWAFKGSTAFWSGGGTADIDHFDSGSGGGAINVAKGDGDEIQHIRRTRDGSVVIYKRFSIWRASFTSDGYIQLQLVNPLIGAVGRRAVTTVDDDQIFLSPYGVFTLGNQPNFPTDILRIKSISQPIDRELEKITPTNLPNAVLHYDFRRRLRLACTLGGATYNNTEFIFKYGAWTRNSGINVNCYTNVNDRSSGSAMLDELNKLYTLYGADDEGRVVQIDKGYSDRGSAIDAYFDTKQDDQGDPARIKKYFSNDVELSKLVGNLTITQYFDSGLKAEVVVSNFIFGGIEFGYVGSNTVGGSEYLSIYYPSNGEVGNISLTRRWELLGRQQKNIRTRFRHNQATGTFGVLSLATEYREKSRRAYDSSNILTVSNV